MIREGKWIGRSKLTHSQTGFGTATNTGFGGGNNNAGGSLFGGGGNTSGGFGSTGKSHSSH